MTTQEEEYTKDIADFLGYPTQDYWWHHKNMETLDKKLPISLNMETSKFHESYDWLMPVWAKIRAFENSFPFKMTEKETVFKIHIQRIKHAMMYSDTPIEPFTKLGEAIRWCNENNIKQQ